MPILSVNTNQYNTIKYHACTHPAGHPHACMHLGNLSLSFFPKITLSIFSRQLISPWQYHFCLVTLIRCIHSDFGSAMML
jgi:hypothetical protein